MYESILDKIEYNDYVYNLEVEDDHSYVANGNIVHNCAMSCVNVNVFFTSTQYLEMVEDIYDTIDEKYKKLISEKLNAGSLSNSDDMDMDFLKNIMS